MIMGGLIYCEAQALKARFMKVTSRSVNYFGFLIGAPNGSSVDYW